LTLPITLRHRTQYRYERPVRLGPQLLRLHPVPGAPPPILRYVLRITPEPTQLHWQRDAWGNQVARLVLAGPTATLDFDVELTADLTPLDPFAFLLDPPAATWPIAYDPATERDLAPFFETETGPALTALRAETTGAGQPTIPLILGLAARVRDRIAYTTREEPGTWPVEHTLAQCSGSCRDMAWLLVQLLRRHGIAARFVSGYLVEPGRAELHAWAEAFLPGAGWIGFDATSGFATAEGHIALAATPRVAEAAPLTGTVEPVPATLTTTLALA